MGCSDKKNLPAVTIAIPFYNSEATLLDAVRSVFAQTHQQWELILMDDGSTDGSLKLARSIDDPRVRVYSDGRNKRLAARLNEITRLARHDFIARMDADDLMTRDRIERQLCVLVAHDDVDLVSAGLVSMSDNLEALGVRVAPEDYEVTEWEVLAGRAWITHAAVLGRREWFRRNPYDESLRLSQDTNLWIRAYARGDFHVKILPAFMYFYREDGNVAYSKLKAAYRIHRRTIRTAASGYPLSHRVRAYTLALAKSAVAFATHRLGLMSMLRARRNEVPIDPELRDKIDREIAAILSTPLPMAAVAPGAHYKP